jgi:hypothetical protein
MRFFSRSGSRSGHSGPRYRPMLETLEGRACPSTMALSYAETTTAGQISVSGQVSAPNPGAGLTVQFSGAYGGTAVTDANGSFSFCCQATLGALQAAIYIGDTTLCSAQVTVTSSPPNITNFQAVRGLNNIYTFSGYVNDEVPSGLVVHFSGLEELTGRTATVDSNNYFSITVTLIQGQTGLASAQVNDRWDYGSNVASVYVSVG